MTTPDSVSGQGLAQRTSPGEPSIPAPRWPLALVAAGALVIIVTYVAVLLTQPPTLGKDLGSTTLWVMLGYLAGAALLAAGTLPLVPRSVYALMPIAIALNITVGQIIGTMTPIPLYLDSLGSVLVGVIAGPAAGALTGVLGNVIWGITINPTVIAFTAGAAFVGAAAGWAARLGAFRTFWAAIIAGAIVGIPSAAVSAPVAAYIYGGGLGVGTGGVVATLQAAGLEMLNATLAQSFTSDVPDKAIIFLLAFLVFRALPRRILRRYSFARYSLTRRSASAPHSLPAER